MPQAEIRFHLGKVHSILLNAIYVESYLCDCLVALRFMNIEGYAFELTSVFEAIDGGCVREFLL